MSKELLIEKAKALSVAATPGPWRRAAPIRPGMRSGVRSGSGYECFDSRDGDDQGSANMVFIAESRTLLPALADLAESEGKRASDTEQELAHIKGTALGGAFLAITERHERDGKSYYQYHADIATLLDAVRALTADRDAALSELAELKARCARDDAGVTIHQCPPKGEGLMPCCGRTPFEVMNDRMTANPAWVNCDRYRLLSELARLKGPQP